MKVFGIGGFISQHVIAVAVLVGLLPDIRLLEQGCVGLETKTADRISKEYFLPPTFLTMLPKHISQYLQRGSSNFWENVLCEFFRVKLGRAIYDHIFGGQALYFFDILSDRIMVCYREQQRAKELVAVPFKRESRNIYAWWRREDVLPETQVRRYKPIPKSDGVVVIKENEDEIPAPVITRRPTCREIVKSFQDSKGISLYHMLQKKLPQSVSKNISRKSFSVATQGRRKNRFSASLLWETHVYHIGSTDLNKFPYSYLESKQGCKDERQWQTIDSAIDALIYYILVDGDVRKSVWGYTLLAKKKITVFTDCRGGKPRVLFQVKGTVFLGRVDDSQKKIVDECIIGTAYDK